jgi:hypothetical protein
MENPLASIFKVESSSETSLNYISLYDVTFLKMTRINDCPIKYKIRLKRFHKIKLEHVVCFNSYIISTYHKDQHSNEFTFGADVIMVPKYRISTNARHVDRINKDAVTLHSV